MELLEPQVFLQQVELLVLQELLALVEYPLHRERVVQVVPQVEMELLGLQEYQQQAELQVLQVQLVQVEYLQHQEHQVLQEPLE